MASRKTVASQMRAALDALLQLEGGALSPTVGQVESVPTLDPKVSRRATPMVRERFAFGDAWRGELRHWLGIKEMRTFPRKRDTADVIRGMREFWTGSAPAAFPPRQVSLFAVTSGVPDSLVFLVWPETDDPTAEPEVWIYLGQGEMRKENLHSYVLFLLGQT